jgi:hypothetical protein
LATGEVRLGVGGLRLFGPAEIERAQVGYSATVEGVPLCTGEEGAWNPHWIVIGHDTACADPLILDTGALRLPILYDFNGQERWAPEPVSASLEAFLASFNDFAHLAVGRSDPAHRDANPVTTREREDFLARVAERNNGEVNLDFWEALLEG